MDAVDTAVQNILDPTIQWGFYGGRKTTPQIYARSVAGFPFKVIYSNANKKFSSSPTPTKSDGPATGSIASASDLRIHPGRSSLASPTTGDQDGK